MVTLTIPNTIVDELIAQARDESPIEACGILAGHDGVVTKYYPMTNADNSTDHFLMVPEEQFSVIKRIRADGCGMLAIHHSHPASPARPSQEDIRLALTPNTIYLILSLMDADNPVIKGFRIESGRVTEVPVQISAES